MKIDRDAVATAFLHLQTPPASSTTQASFASLAPVEATVGWVGGLLRPAGFSRDLQFLARAVDANSRSSSEAYYEINERLEFTRVDSPSKAAEMKKAAEVTSDYVVDAASVLIVDEDGGRWRLPRRTGGGGDATGSRGIREVISERYLAQFDGTFYEVPRRTDKTAPDFRRMKPVSSHRARIADFATWRGMLVLAGTKLDALPDGHYFRASGGPGLWFGAIDDLYALGAPRGEGGPWKDTAIAAGVASDPYIMTNFGKKSVSLSHDAAKPVRFTIEVDIAGDGVWRRSTTIDVPPGQPTVHEFPDGFGANWVRVTADYTGRATAWFRYTTQ